MPLIKQITRWICALGLLVIGAGVSYFVTLSSSGSVNKDVVEYWAASKLLLSHANPYDEASVLRLEREAGVPATQAQIMLNPPCALPFVLHFGLFGARTAIFLWSLTVVICVVLAVRILWIMNGRRNDRLHLLVYVFAPVLACIQLGQIVPLALLGLLGFLWLHRTRPFLAGLCITSVAVKPHILFPFCVALIVWVFARKQYRFLSGALLGLIGELAIPVFFDHQILAQYLPVFHTANGFTKGMPNLSSLVHRIHPQWVYLQYVLAVGAACWAVWWYLRKQSDWDWADEGLLLIVVSVAVAPYSWFEDEALVIPAILSGIYHCADSGKSLISFGLLNGAALALVLFNVPLISGAYTWTSLAWLGWFLYTRTLPVSADAMGDEAGLPEGV